VERYQGYFAQGDSRGNKNVWGVTLSKSFWAYLRPWPHACVANFFSSHFKIARSEIDWVLVVDKKVCKALSDSWCWENERELKQRVLWVKCLPVGWDIHEIRITKKL
jgi:hypothetical protein